MSDAVTTPQPPRPTPSYQEMPRPEILEQITKYIRQHLPGLLRDESLEPLPD